MSGFLQGVISGGGATPSGPASGDLSGTYPSPSVAKINGSTVPAGGSLTTGNVLQVTGAGALSYAAVNLAGGANFVTGSLPAANQSAQTMGGDVSGTTAAATVIKINGSTVPAGGALTTGNTLQVTGGGALSYSALNLAGGANFVTGSLPAANQANQTLSGDVTGNTGASVVSAISGTTPISITPVTLQWATGTVAPTLKQADNTTNSATATTLTLQAQNATGTTSVGGALKLQSGTGTSTKGAVQLFTGATQVGSLSGVAGDFISVGANPASGSIAGSIRLQNSGATNGIAFRNGTNTADIGGISLDVNNFLWVGSNNGIAGSGAPTLAVLYSSSQTQLNVGNTGVFQCFAASTLLNVPLFAIANTQASPSIKQSDITTASATGQTLTLQSQNATGTTSIGGALNLTSGTGTSTHGSILLLPGNNDTLNLSASTTLCTSIFGNFTAFRNTSKIASLTTTTATATNSGISFTMAASSVLDINLTCELYNTGGTGGTVGDSYSFDMRIRYVRVGAAAPVAFNTAPTKLNADFGSNNGEITATAQASVASNTVNVQVVGVTGHTLSWAVVADAQVRE